MSNSVSNTETHGATSIDAVALDERSRDIIRSALDTNILVEAGAGSGKTTLMVDRLLAYVARGTSVENLAAVTFTKKAANELRQRFESKMETASQTDDPVLRARYLDALRNRERMFIGTVHAFCGRILREHALEAGLPPDFTELDQGESNALRDRMWREYIEAAAAEGDPLLAPVVEAGVDPLSLFGAFRNREQYRDVEFEAPELPRPDHAAIRMAVEQILETALQIRVNTGGEPDALIETLERMRRARSVHDNWESVIDFAHDITPLLSSSRRAITQKAWGTTKEQKKAAKEFGELLDDFVTDRLTPWMEQWWAFVYAPVVALLDAGSARALQLRRRTGQLGFDDLLTETARLLRMSGDARRAVGERYRYLLVDEFQDTDPVQAEVCFLIASDPSQGNDWTRVVLRDGALFVVGDPKQSIYRFRRADLAVYRMVEDRIRQCGTVVHLTRNFRSVPSIGVVVNEHFEHEFLTPGEDSPRKDFQAPFAPLIARAGRKHENEGVSRYLVGPPSHVYNPALFREDASKLASWIAARCAPGGDRQPGDFLILTRGRGELAHYARELARRNIPVAVTGAKSDADQVLTELLVILNALADPQNPIAVIAALEGWCIGCSHDDLWKARAGGLEFRITHAPDETRSVAGAGLQQLYHWWIASQRVSAASLLERVMNESGLLLLAASSDLGDRSAGQLLQLVTLLRDNARTDLRGAIALIAQLFEGDEDDAPAMRILQGSVVRLMNLHKSKGLEAKVVVLAAPGKEKDWAPTIATWRHNGAAHGALRVMDDAGQVLAQPANWRGIEAAEQQRDSAEEVRLLYVAATRAEEELVVAQRTPFVTSKGEARVDESSWAPLGHVLAVHARELALTTTVPPGRRTVDVSHAQIREEIAAATSRVHLAARAGWSLESVTEAAKRDAACAADDGASVLQAQSLAQSETHEGLAPTASRSRDSYDVRAFGTLAHAAVEASLRGAEHGREGAALARYIRAMVWHQMPVATRQDREAMVVRVTEAVRQATATPQWIALRKREGLAELPMALVTGDPRAGDGVLSEGIVDAVALAGDSWDVIDWKFSGASDAVWKQQLVAYEAQVQTYIDALRRRTGLRGAAQVVRVRS
ncbi:MAG: UvrD-helicase domain-containing protein [Gemmatimonas sp.]